MSKRNLFLWLTIFMLAFSGCARLSGYTALNAEAPAIAHPDGLKIRINPDQVQGLSVKLESIPLDQFLTGEKGPFLTARQAIPQQLTPKSAYYLIQTRGAAGPATLEVVIPDQAEPWEALALYTFDGKAWQKLPASLDEVRELLVAEVQSLPPNVMVMQAAAAPITIYTGSELSPAAQPALAGVDACDAAVLVLQSDGSLKTGPALNACAGLPRVLLARNWTAGSAPDSQTLQRILDDSLSVAGDRETHIKRLVQLTQQGGYAGLVLDYRGLPAAAQKDYTAFVQALAEALHAQNLWLGVTLTAPAFDEAGTPDYAGYDWTTLGKLADQVRLVMPLLPTAYEPDGEALRLLELALSHLENSRLYPVFHVLSTDGEHLESSETVLRYQGRVQPLQPLPDRVLGGTAFIFGLDKPFTSTTHLPTGAIAVAAQERVYWLGTPEWLCMRLELVRSYRLGGAVLADWLDAGHLPSLDQALPRCKQGEPLPQKTDITWIITHTDGSTSEVHTPLQQPQFNWEAPQQTGKFRIGMLLAGIDRGSVTVNVVAATPTLPPTATPVATPTPQPTSTPAITYEATFVTDVTIPDYTRLDPGTKFTKTWRVMNIGNLPWPASTALIFGYGEAMTDQLQVPVGAVGVGQTVDISVELRAPETDGTYLGYWALMADGQPIFGGGLVVAIVVGPEATPTPSPTPGP